MRGLIRSFPCPGKNLGPSVHVQKCGVGPRAVIPQRGPSRPRPALPAASRGRAEPAEAGLRPFPASGRVQIQERASRRPWPSSTTRRRPSPWPRSSTHDSSSASSLGPDPTDRAFTSAEPLVSLAKVSPPCACARAVRHRPGAARLALEAEISSLRRTLS